jgi:hypothetical protein
LPWFDKLTMTNGDNLVTLNEANVPILVTLSEANEVSAVEGLSLRFAMVRQAHHDKWG